MTVTCPELIAQLDEMRREFGLTQPVAISQSNGVGTAATIGWRRPAILLAADWRTWDPAERRAVLAHELAHVQRRDYAMSVLATLCRAAHFYHPLVRWLAARLRLHQELAADALAAAVVGGKTAYSQALARMALRQDAAVAAGMARPFLSDRTSLIRRITMLRVDMRPMGRTTRWSLMVALGLVAFAASTVRGPAQTPPAAGAAVSAEDLPPFEFGHIPAYSNLLIAIRPAAVLAKPGMKPLADRLNRAIAADILGVFPPNVAFRFEEIEQVVLSGERRTGPSEGAGSLYEDTIFIRMSHDFDWPAVIRAGATAFKKDFREIRPGLYRVADTPMAFCLRVVDRRTVSFLVKYQYPTTEDDEAAALAKAGPAADPAAAWGPAWPKARRAAAVIALDNRKGVWTNGNPKKPAPPALLAAIGRPSHAIACFDFADTATAHLYMTADESSPGQKRANINALATFLLTASRVAPTETEAQRTSLRIVLEMLEGRSIRRDGNTDVGEFCSPAKLADLLTTIEFPQAVAEYSR